MLPNTPNPNNDNSIYAFPFARYLLAKRAIDDRALHPRLWHTFLHTLDDQANQSDTPLHILELGSGIGTMLQRVLDALPPAHAIHYTAVDNNPDNMIAAADQLRTWAEASGMTVAPVAPAPSSSATIAGYPGTTLVLDRQTRAPGAKITIRLVCADCTEFALTQLQPQTIDALIAHAFLDLVDARGLLAMLRPTLADHAALYLTINFDGMTIFEPEINAELDRQIEMLYHRTMDERRIDGQPAGHSQTGRRLFHILRATGYDVLDMGSSDWTLFPGPHGYSADEDFFLRFILGFLQESLTGHPELDASAFNAWLAARRQQIDAAELVYIAHQLDYLARPTPPIPPTQAGTPTT